MPRRQEHHGLRLLSLDGGGIRGLSELLILQDIMKRIQLQDELEHIPSPCDYFDMIGGTSTGGIIALMLGRLRMPVAEVIECYYTLSKKVFSSRKAYGDGKFKARRLEEIIKNVVKERTGDEDERMLDIPAEGNVCKTFVCAMPALHISAGTPHLFRTYQAQSPGIETFNCTIWQAARATSAAPTFFKPIKIGKPGSLHAYVDGGISCNNPIVQVIEEAAAIFPDREVACVISIGTGHSQILSIRPPNMLERLLPLPLNVLPVVKGITVDSERSAKAVAERFEVLPKFYFRLNVEKGLENIGLQDWGRLDDVTTHTERYIKDQNQKLALASLAICEGRRVVATADMGGRTRLKVSLGAGMKRCPPPTPDFTGRNGVLEKMRQYFSNDFGKRHVFVLHGLGGAGKSQIAFKFVEACQIECRPSRFSEVFFVDATTAETIITDLKTIALAKAIGESITDVLHWLAGRQEEWLLIFNNADDTTVNLNKYFPQCSHGNILVTTRNRDMLCYAPSPQCHYHVSGMETRNASALLLKVAGLQEEHGEEIKILAAMIVEKLGNLALAVRQAGAYIFRTQCSLSRYLDIYREHRESLLPEPFWSVQKIDNYEGTVFTAWKISFDKLSSGATKFLQICAFMHHDGISEAIFRNAAVNIKTWAPKLPVVEDDELNSLNMAKEFLGSFGSSGEAWNVQEFFKITSEIQSYSLIEFDGRNETYSIHPLVHAWTRTTVFKTELFCTCVKIVLGMSISWRFEFDDYAFRRTLMPHVDAALQGGGATGLCILENISLAYTEACRWNAAEELQVQVTEAKLKVLGAEHPDTLTSMANLALTYRGQGRLKEAQKIEVQVKEARLKILGIEHPDTLTSMANLALTYWHQGQWKEAEELQDQVKMARLRVLGAEHPDTLTSMANLAWTYRSQGRWKEAAELQLQVKETRARLLGVEHPHTLISMATLASTYRDQGKWKEAELLQDQVKEVRLRELGIDHPDTLTSLANLALTYRNQGRLKEAEKLEIQVQEGRVRVLGTKHPHTLTSMVNLASTYRSQGRWKDAEELEVRAMEARSKLLGAEHPHTLRCAANLALTHQGQGRWKEAEKLHVQVKEARLRVLGPEHPHTLVSMGNLARIYQSQGRQNEAEELQVQVKEVTVRVLGSEHPDTLTNMANLALTYWNQGRWKEAEALQVQVRDTRLRVLGAEHPDTLTSLAALASIYRDQGRWKEAEELQVQVKEARLRVLGAEHLDTLESMEDLASIYRHQSKLKDSDELTSQ